MYQCYLYAILLHIIHELRFLSNNYTCLHKNTYSSSEIREREIEMTGKREKKRRVQKEKLKDE